MVPVAWIRTCDLSHTKTLLYHLSYTGKIGKVAGLEPAITVLETAALTAKLHPYWDFSPGPSQSSSNLRMVVASSFMPQSKQTFSPLGP